MNIKRLSNDVSYYSNLTDTFEDERNMSNHAGIWSIRGLMEPLEGTSELWTDSVGTILVNGESPIPNQKVSDKRVFDVEFIQFNKIINDCIAEYKESHGIKNETKPVKIDTVYRDKKGHNVSSHPHENGYRVIFYLNNDYVGGHVSFTTKEETSINPLVHPKYPENQNQIDFWIKPETFSILIFPASHKYTEHAITSWDRYTLLAGF
jgi:hypothetical protein